MNAHAFLLWSFGNLLNLHVFVTTVTAQSDDVEVITANAANIFSQQRQPDYNSSQIFANALEDLGLPNNASFSNMSLTALTYGPVGINILIDIPGCSGIPPNITVGDYTLSNGTHVQDVLQSDLLLDEAELRLRSKDYERARKEDLLFNGKKILSQIENNLFALNIINEHNELRKLLSCKRCLIRSLKQKARWTLYIAPTVTWTTLAGCVVLGMVSQVPKGIGQTLLSGALVVALTTIVSLMVMAIEKDLRTNPEAPPFLTDGDFRAARAALALIRRMSRIIFASFYATGEVPFKDLPQKEYSYASWLAKRVNMDVQILENIPYGSPDRSLGDVFVNREGIFATDRTLEMAEEGLNC